MDQQSLAAWVQERGGTHHLPDDGPTDATDRLLACLLAIKAEIGLVDDRYIQRLANFILTRCHFLQIGAASLDDAYILFRSLNSRGLALNDLDIIRAELVGPLTITSLNWRSKLLWLGTTFKVRSVTMSFSFM